MDIPRVVGHHIHLALCWPDYGTILPTRWDLPVTVTLHEVPQDAVAVHLRAQWGLSGNALYRRTSDITVPLDANRNGVRSFTLPLDLSGIPSGSHEFRFSYLIRYTVNGQTREQFQSYGLQGCVQTCVNPERTLPWIEARGWYTDREYANARLLSPTSCLIRGGRCTVEMKPGSGGLPTVEHIAAIDPNYHASYGGIEVSRGSGAFKGTITIPSNLSSGTHKLVIVSNDGKNAGVLALTFEVP